MNDRRFDKLEGKIEEVKDDVTDLKIDLMQELSEIKTTLIVNTQELKEHKEGVIQNRGDIGLIKTHVAGVNGFFHYLKLFFMVIAGVSAIIGSLWGLFKLL